MTLLLSFVVLSLARVSTTVQTDKNCSYGETSVLCVLPVMGTHVRNTSLVERETEIGDVISTSNANVTCINRNLWIEMPRNSLGHEDRVCRVDSRWFALQQGLSARDLAHLSCKLRNRSYQNGTELNYVHHICKIPATGRLRVFNVNVRSMLTTSVEAIDSTCQCEVSIILKWIEGILQHSSVSCTESQHSLLASVQLQDVDECINDGHNCDANAYCINTPGSFRCVCKKCYSGDGVSCTRTICSTLPQVLRGNVSAAATFCGETALFTCQTGYRLLGSSTRECGIDGQWTEQQPTCEDIDECKQQSHNCDSVHGNCINSIGSYTCLCDSCYTGDGVSCQLVNCSNLLVPVYGNLTGNSTECGSTTIVSCSEGYRLSGSRTITCLHNGSWSDSVASCYDINECSLGMHNCDITSEICTNSFGSFMCVCNTGFTAVGQSCFNVTYTVSGYVRDAFTTSAVKEATVALGNRSTTSSSDGVFTFSSVFPTTYILNASADGYYSNWKTVAVSGNITAGTSADITLTKRLSIGTWEVVLTWGEYPDDLDSYMIVPGGCTVSYQKDVCNVGNSSVTLDDDATHSYSSESIQINNGAALPGTYSHYVHVYTSGATFVAVNATVDLYNATGRVLTINSPAGDSVYWDTFNISTVTNTYTIVNKLR